MLLGIEVYCMSFSSVGYLFPSAFHPWRHCKSVLHWQLTGLSVNPRLPTLSWNCHTHPVHDDMWRGRRFMWPALNQSQALHFEAIVVKLRGRYTSSRTGGQ